MKGDVELVLTSNSREYANEIINFMAAFNLNARQALRYQGRLLGETLIKLTPPRNLKQGQDRVAKDIRKVILGLDADAFEQAHAVLKGNEDIVRAFVNKKGEVYGVDKALYKPDATFEDLDRHHQANRLKNGRVSDAGTKTRDIGRWKFITKLIVPKTVLEEYIESVEPRVGRARGGWASGTMNLGGKPAGWVADHARTAGSFVNKLQDRNPSFTFQNKSEWAGSGDGAERDRIVTNAVRSRVRDIRAVIIRAKKEAGRKIFK